MERITFCFHNALVFELLSDDPAALEFFAAEYQLHKTETAPAGLPTVNLRFARPRPGLEKQPGSVNHTHKALASWTFTIKINPQRVEITASGNRTAIPMIHHMLVHPSLRYLAAENGLLMLHAGAIARAGRSLILTGQGGAGKTTTTSLALALGQPAWSLHADDYVFLAPGPHSYAYLTRSHLYRDLLRWVPELAERLTGVERLRLEFFGRMRALSGERLKWPVRLEADRLWPGRELIPQAVPAGVIFLRRGAVDKPQLERITPDEAIVDELLNMNFGEARHYLILLRKANALDENWLAGWKAKERALITQLLSEIPTYTLTQPRQLQKPGQLGGPLVKKLDELV